MSDVPASGVPASEVPASGVPASGLRAAGLVRRPAVSALAIALLATAGCAKVDPDAMQAVSAGSEPASSPVATASRTAQEPSATAPTPSASRASGSDVRASHAAATPSATPSVAASATPSASSSASPDASATPPAKPSAPALLSAGDSGDRVRELQHRLQQLAWFEGRITGSYGDATAAAVRGYQAKRELPVTGRVDQQTWDSLLSRTKQPTHDQLYNIVKAGPALLEQGSKGAKVQELQARLKQIGWFSGKVTTHYGSATADAVKQFQAKRGIPTTGEVDQRTLDLLHGMTRQPTTDELNNVAHKVAAPRLDPRCLTGRVLCISKSSNRMSWVVDGKVQDTFSVRFGSELTPTREGTFSVGWKSRDHVSTLYHTAMPFAMFFSGGQAVHYSADFAARGYNGASHGCVNVRDYDGIRWLFGEVNVGDRVVVHR